jgi:hypothetical protein
MLVVLILYAILASAVLVRCSTSETRASLHYVAISRSILGHLIRCCHNLVVIELRRTTERVISGALNVPTDQLEGILRWIPPRTTLVLCGTSEVALCRDAIEMNLLSLGIEVVYVFDDDVDSSTVPTAPQVAARSV